MRPFIGNMHFQFPGVPCVECPVDGKREMETRGKLSFRYRMKIINHKYLLIGMANKATADKTEKWTFDTDRCRSIYIVDFRYQPATGTGDGKYKL